MSLQAEFAQAQGYGWEYGNKWQQAVKRSERAFSRAMHVLTRGWLASLISYLTNLTWPSLVDDALEL